MDHQEIIAKYLNGESSCPENKQLLSWVRANEVNQEEFVELCKLWHLSNKRMETFNTDAAYMKFKHEVDSRSSGGAVTELKEEKVSQRKFNMKMYAVSAAASVVVALGVLLFNMDPKNESYANMTGGVEEVHLADGSTTYLNRSAILNAPVKFKGDNRIVDLTGEAFFEVKKDNARPFIVKIGGANVTVVGTSFDVKQDTATKSCVVIVNTGIVKLSASSGEVTLSPGERGLFDAGTGEVSESINEDANYISWKTGVLFFNNTSLSKVASDIERHYGVKLSVDPRVDGKESLTATFDNQPVEAVMKSIELALNITVANQGSNIYILTPKN